MTQTFHEFTTIETPKDDFTPHGYLHVPGHTRNLSPKGVVRSHEAGFRFHVPAYAGMYGGRRETYRAGMSVAVNGTIALKDFDRASSPVHTKNRMVFDLETGTDRVRCEWGLVDDDVLVASITPGTETELAVLIEYQRTVSANGEWGESGLTGRIENGRVILQSFEDGDAFVFSSSMPILRTGFTQSEDEAHAWIRNSGPMRTLTAGEWANALGSRGDVVHMLAVVVLDNTGSSSCDISLARGATLAKASSRLDTAMARLGRDRLAKQVEDEAFWKTAPRLSGDWPDHWRRGMIYDFETLRMMVMNPAGIYQHIWDGMQIQAPRVVLGEAAIDALLLSYADPGLARELLYGVFADAPEPNVPCSREDGTYNMVSARGEVCGTGPQWGYPWLVLDWLWIQDPDRNWLERIYPHLDAYLDWWLMYRSHPDGWLWFECSWESGQDGTPRLGDQPLGGGHPTPHVRPVDLEASFAHAGQVMSRFAEALGLVHDAAKWSAIADEHAERTQALWNGDRFADFDAGKGAFTDIVDVMQLSPIQLGIAEAGQAELERSAIRDVNPDSLVWPMFAWTVADAAMRAGERDHAVAIAENICDRAWGYWDARVHDPDRTMPGITCEYWPLSGRCGGEGYGWGAFQIHLFFHTVLGYEPSPTGITIAPNLPAVLRVAGGSYGVALSHDGVRYEFDLMPVDENSVTVRINGSDQLIPWGERIALTA